MITNLASMMVERLNSFKLRSKKLPDRVLVYRDGVSEVSTHFSLNYHRRAYWRNSRIFTRVNFPSSSQRNFQRSKLRSENLTPLSGRTGPNSPSSSAGNVTTLAFTPQKPLLLTVMGILGLVQLSTVVLRLCMTLISSYKVSRVFWIVFYQKLTIFLSAHGGLQGTTRPTHYYVVHDEIGFKADELQGLTNAVSYMFARATKAVSLVSPAYYADLACERGRCYLHKLLQGIGGTGTTTASGEEQVMKEAETMWHRGVAGTLKETMFYL